MTLTETMSSLRVKLDLPKNILEEYERQAEDDFGVPLEQLLTSRLTDCANYTSAKPIYVTDEQRRDLEQLLKRNLSNAEQLLTEVKRVATLRVDKVDVALSPEVKRRLGSRHIDKSKGFEEWLSRLVVTLLEQYVEMR